MEPGSFPMLQRYFIKDNQVPHEVRSDFRLGVPLNMKDWNFREEALESLVSASHAAATFSQEGIEKIEELSELARSDVAGGRLDSPAVQSLWMNTARYLGHRAVHAQMMVELLSLDPARLQAAFDSQRRHLTSQGDPLLTGAFEGDQKLLSVRPRESVEDKVLRKALQSWVLGDPATADRRRDGKVHGGESRLEALNRLEAMMQHKFSIFGDSPATRSNLQREYRKMHGASLRELRRLVPKNIPPQWDIYGHTIRRLRRVSEVGQLVPTTSWTRMKAKARALVSPQEVYEFVPCMFEGRIITTHGQPLFRKVPAPNWWDMIPEIGKSVIKHDFPPAMVLDLLGNICTAVAIRNGRVAGHKGALTPAQVMGGVIQGDLQRSVERKPSPDAGDQCRQN